MRLCACGCGEEFPRKGKRKYVTPAHGQRVYERRKRQPEAVATASAILPVTIAQREAEIDELEAVMKDPPHGFVSSMEAA